MGSTSIGYVSIHDHNCGLSGVLNVEIISEISNSDNGPVDITTGKKRPFPLYKEQL